VAVPKASSLRGAAISQALVESHLLRQTAIRDEWKTANGRTVVVVKDSGSGRVRLMTGRGFPVQGNSVDVLAEDLWYGPSSDQGLQLVSISDTLEKDSLSTLNSFATTSLDSDLPQKLMLHNGKKPEPEPIAEGKTYEELQWCADDKKCVKYIESLAGSGEPLMKLEKKLVEFSNTYVFARNYEEETAQKLRSFATQFAQETGGPYSDAAYKAALCHTINILESKIWSSLKDLYSSEDMKARSAMMDKVQTRCSGIGVSEDFLDVDFSEPLKEFKALGETKSPPMKLVCLQRIHKKTIDAICKGRKQAAVTVFGSTASKSNKVIGMDELLPLFIYVVCQSEIPDFVTTFTFIKHFSYDLGASQSGEFLTTLIESVVQNLVSL